LFDGYEPVFYRDCLFYIKSCIIKELSITQIRIEENYPEGRMAQVLVVDDDEQILTLLCRLMEKEGHGVTRASDGLMAFNLFKESPTDIVITDLIMPNKEGIELIQELRSIRNDVKIIAYSGGGQLSPDSYLDFAKGVGADRVFSKPIAINDIKQAVKELLAL